MVINIEQNDLSYVNVQCTHVSDNDTYNYIRKVIIKENLYRSASYDFIGYPSLCVSS